MQVPLTHGPQALQAVSTDFLREQNTLQEVGPSELENWEQKTLDDVSPTCCWTINQRPSCLDRKGEALPIGPRSNWSERTASRIQVRGSSENARAGRLPPWTECEHCKKACICSLQTHCRSLAPWTIYRSFDFHVADLYSTPSSLPIQLRAWW